MFHRMAAPTQIYSPIRCLKARPAGTTTFKLLVPPGSPAPSDPSTPKLLASSRAPRRDEGTCQVPEKRRCCGVCTSLSALVVPGLVEHPAFPLPSFTARVALSGWPVPVCECSGSPESRSLMNVCHRHFLQACHLSFNIFCHT